MSKLLRTGRDRSAAAVHAGVRALSAAGALATSLVLFAGPALAQTATTTPSGGGVSVTPSAAGLGTLGPKMQNLLNMTAFVALMASAGSILVGAAIWGLSKHFNNYGGANKGMQLAIGGAVGGLLVASAATIVNTMFGA